MKNFVSDWAIHNGTISAIADTSDFEPGEIRTLAPEILEEKWTGKLLKKVPVYGDLGIDCDRSVYVHLRSGWSSIK